MAEPRTYDSVNSWAEGDGEHIHISFRTRVDPYRTDPETETVLRIPIEQADYLQSMLYLLVKHERCDGAAHGWQCEECHTPWRWGSGQCVRCGNRTRLPRGG